MTLADAGRLLNSVTLTRRMVVSIMAELYDPCGFWEPWKLQLKLMSQTLAGMEWNEHICAEDQELWKQQLSRLVDFPKLSIPRICIPADKDSLSGIRLICVTDAAINAGGAAVYAGRKLKDSCYANCFRFCRPGAGSTWVGEVDCDQRTGELNSEIYMSGIIFPFHFVDYLQI